MSRRETDTVKFFNVEKGWGYKRGSAGTVRFWNEKRRDGFVATDDYRGFFAHASQLVEGEELRKNERVTFLSDVGRDGRAFARQIMRVGE
jgi:cold shock CspA family protein